VDASGLDKMNSMDDKGNDMPLMEDSPSYAILKSHGMLTTEYRKSSFEDIFSPIDFKANSSHSGNWMARFASCWCIPGVGCAMYNATHTEMFVPSGHVGLLIDNENRFLFAQPGMHNIPSMWIQVDREPEQLDKVIVHGNRTLLVVQQGTIGVAWDNGQPKLFPPGIHSWLSETLRFESFIPLDRHVIEFGPYTLLTVNEGYAAVTQNNGKQHILPGGQVHLLTHQNWRFEKFMTTKIQTDDLEEIKATSADNIILLVNSTVNWKIVDVEVAATKAAETMSTAKGDGSVDGDITKLRKDVLKQAIASLASFIGGVNYSDNFHMASKLNAAKASGQEDEEIEPAGNPEPKSGNPIYDHKRMAGAMEHANSVTSNYGIEIMSINIISATPVDKELTRALASGSVAAAESLRAETAARGQAKASKVAAEATATKARIEAEGEAEAEVLKAKGLAEAELIRAEASKKAADLLSQNKVAVELAKMDKSAECLNSKDKFFFGQEPAYMSNLILKDSQPVTRSALPPIVS
jgi:regulator of protease activity HflC (stomatin/prohibitin superfamily)